MRTLAGRLFRKRESPYHLVIAGLAVGVFVWLEVARSGGTYLFIAGGMAVAEVVNAIVSYKWGSPPPLRDIVGFRSTRIPSGSGAAPGGTLATFRLTVSRFVAMGVVFLVFAVGGVGLILLGGPFILAGCILTLFGSLFVGVALVGVRPTTLSVTTLRMPTGIRGHEEVPLAEIAGAGLLCLQIGTEGDLWWHLFIWDRHGDPRQIRASALVYAKRDGEGPWTDWDYLAASGLGGPAIDIYQACLDLQGVDGLLRTRQLEKHPGSFRFSVLGQPRAFWSPDGSSGLL